MSIPIVNSKANIWVTFPNTPACDLGRPIPNYWLVRIWTDKASRSADQHSRIHQPGKPLAATMN
ncbi:MAG: hypothetical protein U1D30_17420 [Planctomycetota bacterium]